MENYIIQNEHAFTNEFCDEIIETYHNMSNMQKIYDIKNNYYTKSLNTNSSFNNDNDKDNNTTFKHITCINTQLTEILQNSKYNFSYSRFTFNDYIFSTFEKNSGYMSYINDFKVLDNNVFSSYEFVIFLNDIDDGGCIEIMGIYTIKPKKGKLLIFPSGWCFPYSHKIPFSCDKYIISGKIFHNF